MAFGDILSSIGSGIKEAAIGSPGQFEQIPNFTPEQLEFIRNQIMPLLTQRLSALGSNKFDFAPIAQEARRGFMEQTVPALAERFTAMTGGKATSPAFASQLGAAGAGLESGLAALGSKYGLAQQGLQNQQLQSLLGIGLMPQYQTAYRPGSGGLLQTLGSSPQGMGQLASLLTGGISSAAQLPMLAYKWLFS